MNRLYRLFIGFLSAMIFMQISLEVTGQTEGVWRQVAPGMAGSNRAIYADKVNAKKLWIAADMGNDYLSTNGGKHWETIIPNDGVWTQRNTLSDECVISDHKNNKIVLSLNKKDIYLSKDGGKNFSKITSYASGSEPNSVWYTAAAHPVAKDTWYLANGLDNKYLRTAVNPNPLKDIDTNRPKIWKITGISSGSRTISAVSGVGMDKNTAVFDLICHPNATKYPGMLFAATSTGLYRKTGGKNWVKIMNGSVKADYHWNGSKLTLYALKQVTYSVNGNKLVSSGGVYKTTVPETMTSGWTNITNGLHINMTKVEVNNNHFKSMLKAWFGYKNGQESSIAKPTSFLQDYSDILCDPTNANKAYLSVYGGSVVKPVYGGIWATTNGGSSWYAASRMGNGYSKETYWSSKQAGKTNSNVPLGVHDHKFPDFVKYDRTGARAMAVAADGTLYVGINKGYYTGKYNSSTDKWVSVDNTQVGDSFYGHGNANTGAYAVIPDKHKKDEMFILQYEASAYKSTTKTRSDFPGIVGVDRIPALIDIGETWAPGQPMLTPMTIANHPTNSSVFYTISQRTGDLMKVTGNGKSFTILGEIIPVPNTTIVSNMKCIYWSDLRIASNGKTMYTIAEIIDTDNRPMGQTRIYNPVPQKGIYKSTDEGKTWINKNTGLPKTANGRNSSNQTVGTNGACVKALVMAPENDNVLYTAIKRYRAPKGTSGWVNGGLYRSANGSNSWSKMTIPSGIKSVWDVWLHESNGKATKIYIAAGGEGTKAEWGEGGVWVANYRSGGGYKASDWKKVFNHPFASLIRTSYFNGNHLLVATRESTSNGRKDAGTFYSITGGGNNSQWTKLNTGRGGMMIGDISFDGGTPNRVWSACESSGTYTALLPIGNNNEDKLTSVGSSTTVYSNDDFYVAVDYSTKVTRDIRVNFKSSDGTVFGNQTKSVSGEGTAYFAIKVNNAPLGSGYYLQGYMTTVNGSWANKIGEVVEQRNMTVIAPSDELINISSPNTVQSGTVFTAKVKYSTTTDRDIRVNFKRSNGTLYSYQIKTVSGSGTANFNITPNNAPSESGYYLESYMTPKGGNWSSRIGGIVRKENVTVSGNGARTLSDELRAESNEDDVLLYPNPVTNGFLNIKFPSAEKNHLTITDLSGQVVYQETIDAETVNLSVKDYTKGMYMIRVENEREIWLERLAIR
ncbi:T9SS type A sorting domain-containing protein [Reichenbachiella versicolor]|uniref:T9SS type A sorting domain-containing protein n=1 Tax=Reichenbachiella versicolor TaxID=1821036 RepID=UPI000D6E7372|nr:T9SS type A sorting domain-containing protein [Reichenbachiella versicolor]